jgi:catechol 2,3-dioxygenase-like lactoylglutathione lyase family enzyme
MKAERISAIPIKVSDLAKSAHFYNKLLGLKILYEGQEAYLFFFASDAERKRYNSQPRAGSRDR